MSRVLFLITEDTGYLNEITRLGQSPIHLSAGWPEGLSLILDHGGREYVNKTDNAGFLPVSYASRHKNPECLKILLEADSALYSPSTRYCSSDVLFDTCRNCGRDILQVILKHLVDRQRRLHRLALTTYPTILEDLEFPIRNNQLLEGKASKVYSILVEKNVDVPEALAVYGDGNIFQLLLTKSQWFASIEHPVAIAQMSWDAGFRNVDEYDDKKKTPLMRGVPPVSFKSDNHMAPLLYLLSWLVDRGADLRKCDLRLIKEGGDSWALHTPAAHFIALTLTRFYDILWLLNIQPSSSMLPERVEAAAFSFRVIHENVCDNCICGCSSAGCLPLSQMLKHLWDWDEWDWDETSYLFPENQPKTSSYFNRRKLYNCVGIKTSSAQRHLTNCS